MAEQQRVWAALQGELREAGIAVLEGNELSESERTWLETYFIDQVFPILTPLAVDPAHPFPFLPNGGFSAIFKLHRQDDKRPLMALRSEEHTSELQSQSNLVCRLLLEK